jgi:hypothetical protein
MNDVRDEPLGAALDRMARAIEAESIDRLPEVLHRGSRKRAARFTAIAAAIAVFVTAIAWAGLTLSQEVKRIPADIADWRTFASLEDNGWTIQVPPTWHVVELPACRGAPKRIGVMVTNVEFEFRDPRGGPPDCGDRLVFAGFPRDGVAFAFMPIVGDSIPGFPFQLPDTILPLTPDLLVQTDGIRGGPSESFQSIWLFKDWIGTVRRFVGPEAAATDIAALDGMLGSFQVPGAPRWLERKFFDGPLTVALTNPDTWPADIFGGPAYKDAPTPIMSLTSPGMRLGSCPFSHLDLGSFGEFGVAVYVADWSTAFTSDVTTLKPRPESLRFQDAVETQKIRCGSRLRVLSFVYEEAGRPIHMDVAATETVYREQPEMLLHILNSIRVSKA